MANLVHVSTAAAPRWGVRSRAPAWRALDGRLNRAIGLTSLLLGALSGLIIGLWAFGGPFGEPPALGGYTELPRRLIRLAHIAFFALGILNLVMCRQLADLSLPARTRRWALACMNLGNVLMPTTLLAAAFQPALIYALPVPALALSFTFAVGALGGWRQWARRCRR